MQLFCFYIVKCEFYKFNLSKLFETKDFYQITLFVSENCTKSLAKSITTDLKIPSFQEFPKKVYSFGVNNPRNNRQFYDKSSQTALTNMLAIQESLVLLYEINLSEVKSFIDFFVPYLSVRYRPKCLIILSSYNFESKNQEIYVINALKWAWNKRFLDFTILKAVFENNLFGLFSVVYYYNPFNNIIYLKNIHINGIKLFPNKVLNGHGYPFYFPDSSKRLIMNVRQTNRNVKIQISNYYRAKFLTEICNLSIFSNLKKLTDKYSGVETHDYFRFKFLDYYLIPTSKDARNIVAYVPVFILREHVFSKMLFEISIIFGINLIFLYTVNFFKPALGYIKVFDFVRLLFGQSIARKPIKTAHRLIYLTLVVATVKTMNDFLIHIISMMFEDTEIPFESFKDLYNSHLKTYANFWKLNEIIVTDDPYLLKIVNRTKTGVFNTNVHCLDFLLKWKNISCIYYSFDVAYGSSYLQKPDGFTMKVAEPPIISNVAPYYRFSNNSPFAVKFLELNRRVDETRLLHWPSLVEKKSNHL